MRQRVSTDASKRDAIKMEYNTLKRSIGNVNRQRWHLSKELWFLPDLFLILIAAWLYSRFFYTAPTMSTYLCVDNVVATNTTGEVMYVSGVIEAALPTTGAE